MDRFGWEALEQECVRLGVSEEELVRFAIAYYLADVDSGRVARDIPEGLASRPEADSAPGTISDKALRP
ncbi:MAG: hypothetical protein ACYDHT_11685 [Solirubrobacteraceae bacterium]